MLRAATKMRGFERLTEHLSNPLFKNAYALILNTGMVSGLGFLYWIVAARFYDPEIVGISGALIPTMIFLAALGSLNMESMLNRFIPTAGLATRRLVVYAYVAAVIMTGIVATLFLLTQAQLSEESYLAFGGPWFGAWFIISSVVWAIFVLQDNALIGLRQSVWVPVENSIFGVVKLVVLVGLAATLPRFGIFVSWTVPVAISLLPVNYLIFRRLIPNHLRRVQETEKDPVTSVRSLKLGRYVAWDYVGQLFSMAPASILPLIVVSQVSNEANAYFYTSWLIATTPLLMTVSMSQSLLVESATDMSKLAENIRSIVMKLGRFVLLLVAFLFLAAPLILRVYGETYATEGTALFRLLVLGMIFASISTLALSVARVLRKMRIVVAVSGLACIMTLGLAYAVASMGGGVTGVGLAYVTAQAVVALTVSVWVIVGAARMTSEDPAPAPLPAPSTPTDGAPAESEVDAPQVPTANQEPVDAAPAETAPERVEAAPSSAVRFSLRAARTFESPARSGLMPRQTSTSRLLASKSHD